MERRTEQTGASFMMCCCQAVCMCTVNLFMHYDT